ncbi:MAG: sigma-70 family RNA polymerase sigma factor [Gemmatimonadales bacterium]|nr:sigma-70 family RNA polymerase sigma factor [Gemmatimonadales bacterium]
MTERPDWTEGIRRGDAVILDAVVRAALPGLLRAARAAGLPPDESEDVVHATLLVFLRRASDFDGRARASTWMHGILIRKVSEARRASHREEPADDIDAMFEQQFDSEGSWVRPPAGPAVDLARADTWRLLAACLERLPQRQRDAFILRETDGIPTEELCKIMSVTPNNLGVLLFRARNRLRHCLEHHGITGSADADV